MATRKVMRLIDPRTGFMECKVCGNVHLASLAPGGHYIRGSWQCINKCRLEDLRSEQEQATAQTDGGGGR